ncbi:MAG: hypothetical protein ACI841_003056 [Planctomycetota bacterium]|jgi:hypothetical protein
MTTTKPWFDSILQSRLDDKGRAWYASSADRIASGMDDAAFAGLISMASRFAPRGRLTPSEVECAGAAKLLPGWKPERWTALECLRIALLLSRTDLEQEGAQAAIEAVFEFADDGELCAMYKSLAHLPQPERFLLRAAEGCRTNIVPVFEAVACDTPYPVKQFDDIAWNQLCIKAIFIGAPLWRVHGLDTRLSSELARIALDLVEERRSAGRDIQPELWLCVGKHGGERGIESLEREIASSNTIGMRAASLGLARAGHTARLAELLEGEADDDRRAQMSAALEGACDQTAFGDMNSGN